MAAKKKYDSLAETMSKPQTLIGPVLVVLGLFLIAAYFKDWRPAFLDRSVFAVFSFYLNPVFFKLIKTNLVDELGMALFLSGLWIMHLGNNTITYKAIRYTLVLWLALYWLVYGLAIFVVSMLIFPAFMAIYKLLEKGLIGSKNHSIG